MGWTVLRVLSLLLVVAAFVIAAARVRQWWCPEPACWLPTVVVLTMTGLVGVAVLSALVTGQPGGVRVVALLGATAAPLVHVWFVSDRMKGRVRRPLCGSGDDRG